MSTLVTRYESLLFSLRRKIADAVVNLQTDAPERAHLWRVRADGLRQSMRVATRYQHYGETNLAIEMLERANAT